MIDLMKASSKNGLILNWINEKTFDKHFTLAILTHTENIPNKTISIDQQVYFLTSKFELFEKYNINNLVVLQKLGHYFNDIYFPDENIEQNFLKRRKNFFGSKLIALTENYYGVDFNEDEVKNSAMYFPSNDTYDVTNFVNGSGHSP